MSALDFVVGALISVTGTSVTPEPPPGHTYFHTETAAITLGLPDKEGRVWLCPMFDSLLALPDGREMQLRVLVTGARIQHGDTADCDRAAGNTKWRMID